MAKFAIDIVEVKTNKIQTVEVEIEDGPHARHFAVNEAFDHIDQNRYDDRFKVVEIREGI